MRFCGECGAALVTAPAPAPSPAPTSPPEPEGERKQLTVLFADVPTSPSPISPTAIRLQRRWPPSWPW
jgi:hypothetical protein